MLGYMTVRRKRRWRVYIEDTTGRNISERFDHVPLICDVLEVLATAKRWDLVNVVNVTIEEGLE